MRLKVYFFTFAGLLIYTKDMALDGIIALDKQISLVINGLHSELTDKIWVFFSDVQIWFPMYGLIVGLLFWRLGWKKALVFTLALALTVLCCDQTANLFKEGFGRIRPCNDEFMIANGAHILTQNGSFSFFSGHACNAFGFACCSLMAFREDRRLRYRGYAAFIFIWAFMVSISRIFVAAHFFGDVLVGAVMGTIMSLCIAFAARLACRRIGSAR